MNDTQVDLAATAAATEDPAFSGVFPGFVAGDGCSCGQDHGEDVVPSLRPYRPVALDDAAERASTSMLIRELLAFADWVGDGRPLTSSTLLEPADAVAAARDLGLLNDETLRDGQLASAEDLPEVHELWTAAVRAGLLTIRAGQAGRGDARRIWETGTAQERLDSWARALGGVLASRGEQAQSNRGFDLPMPDVLPVSAHTFYAYGLTPVPAMIPGLMMMADLDPADEVSVMTSAALLPSSVTAAVKLWTRAGVLEPVDPRSASLGSTAGLLGEIEEGLGSDWLAPMAIAVRDNGYVQLTSLGEYGLMRLLRAHGFTVPMPGDLVDTGPAELLDVLAGFRLDAALDEATAWLTARGGEALPHLRQLGRLASTKYPIGPARRASFTRMLIAATTAATPEQAVALVEAFADDPWLAASAAVTAARLGLRELTLAEQLWLEVDHLSQMLDDGPGLQAVDVAHAPLLGVLGRPGAVAAMAEVRHVHAPAVFRLAAQALDDEQLARQVRAAAGGVVDLRSKKRGRRREQRRG